MSAMAETEAFVPIGIAGVRFTAWCALKLPINHISKASVLPSPFA